MKDEPTSAPGEPPEPSRSDGEAASREETLHRLTEELARAREEGRAIDLAAIARAHGVDLADAERCLAAVDALAVFKAGEGGLGPAAMADLPDLPEDYQILEEIGRGGMGIVYKVRQKSLDRILALKVLLRFDRGRASGLERFRREAKSLARLRHPNIVSIHEVGESKGTVYFTMDWIDGRPLDRLTNGHSLWTEKTVAILRQVAGAIAHAHSQGVIHRDLKPSNILVDRDGKAYVVDFGLAQDTSVPKDLTRSGHIIGSPAYMSPEQARGEASRIGPATDVYALGTVLYECLTGKPPFHGMPLAETLRAVLDAEPRAPRRLNPSAPRDLESICRKALAKEPRRRYGSAAEFLEELDRFAEGRPVRARPLSLPGIALRAALRHRRGLAAGFGAAALLAICLFLFLVPRLPPSASALFSVAREMEASGDPRSALEIYKKLAKGKPLLPAGFTEDEIRRRWLGASIPVARELFRQGRLREARKALEDGLAAIPETLPSGRPVWPEIETALWELGGLQALDGDFKAALETLDFYRSGSSLLERIDQAFQEGSEPGRKAAVAVAASLVFGSYNSESLPVIEWLCRPGWPRSRLFVEVLAAAPDVDAARQPEKEAKESPAAACSRLIGNWGITSQYRYFSEALKEFGGPELSDELAAALDTPGLREEARLLLAEFLCRSADIPFRAIIGHDLDDRSQWFLQNTSRQAQTFPGVTAESAVRLWKEIRSLPAPEAFRRRVEFAVRMSSDTEDEAIRFWIESWLRDHTDLTAFREKRKVDRPAAVQAWWKEHGGEDPRSWLARALAIEVFPGNPPVEELLRRCREGRGDFENHPWIYYLLALGIPEGGRLPIVDKSFLSEESFYLACDRWRRGGRAAEPHIARLARLDFLPGEVDPRIGWQTAVPIRVGERVKIEHIEPADDDAERWRSFDFSLHLPGGGAAPRPPDRIRRPSGHSISEVAHLTWRFGDRGVTLDWQKMGDVMEGMALLGRRGCPDDRNDREPRGWPAGARPFVWVSALEAPGASADGWTFADWKARFEETIRTHCRKLPEGVSIEKAAAPEKALSWEESNRWHSLESWAQHTVASLFELGQWIPLHGLDRLEGWISWIHGTSEGSSGPASDLRYKDLSIPARLLAGEAALLADGTFDAWKEKNADDLIRPVGNDAIGRSAWYWWRLFRSAADPRIRERALAELEKMAIPDRTAALIAQDIRKGSLEVPGWLVAKVRRAPWRLWWEPYERHGPSIAWPAAFYLFPGAWALVLLLARRSPFLRRFAAGMLVFSGMLVAMVDFRIGGWSLFPDSLGYAIAAIGAFAFVRGVQGRARLLPAAAFALAAAASLAAELLLEASWARQIVFLGGFLAFFSLPVLPRYAFGSSFWDFWAGHLVVAAIALVLLSPQVSGAGEMLGGPWFLAFVLWAWSGLAPAGFVLANKLGGTPAGR